MMDSYLTMMNQIHVLFVDHELPLPAMNTITLLETCQYRVTHVELATGAMQVLINGKTKFDFIIANINSPDVQAFKLLQLAVSIDIPVIMMLVGSEDDTIMASRVIEIGAFLCIKRPTTIDMVRCLWQHVARNNIRVMREHERLVAANYGAPRGIEENYYHPENLMKENGKYKRQRSGTDDEEESYHEKVKRKICIEWTEELHQKFENAVHQLGDGSCFPKEILELMNVPGLTRMQVASHLQKCRNHNWRSPEERKLVGGLGYGEGGSNQKVKRFGLLPRFGKGDSSSKNNGDNETELQHYGEMDPHEKNGGPGIINSSADDDILNLQDMGCFINSSFAAFADPQSSSTNFQFVQANSKVASGEWPTSSETSNFCSNDSETGTI